MFQRKYCIKEKPKEFLDAIAAIIDREYPNRDFWGFKNVLSKKSATKFILKKAPLYRGYYIKVKMNEREHYTEVIVKIYPHGWLPDLVYNLLFGYFIAVIIYNHFFAFALFIAMIILFVNIFAVAKRRNDANYFFSITDKAFSMMTPYNAENKT